MVRTFSGPTNIRGETRRLSPEYRTPKTTPVSFDRESLLINPEETQRQPAKEENLERRVQEEQPGLPRTPGDLNPEQKAEYDKLDEEQRTALKPVQESIDSQKQAVTDAQTQVNNILPAGSPDEDRIRQSPEYQMAAGRLIDEQNLLKDYQNQYDALAQTYAKRKLTSAGYTFSDTGPTTTQASKAFEQTKTLAQGGEAAFNYAKEQGLIPKDAIYIPADGKRWNYTTPAKQKEAVNTLISAGVLTTDDLRNLDINTDISGQLDVATTRYNKQQIQNQINALVSAGVMGTSDIEALGDIKDPAKVQTKLEPYRVKYAEKIDAQKSVIERLDKSDYNLGGGSYDLVGALQGGFTAKELKDAGFDDVSIQQAGVFVSQPAKQQPESKPRPQQITSQDDLDKSWAQVKRENNIPDEARLISYDNATGEYNYEIPGKETPFYITNQDDLDKAWAAVKKENNIPDTAKLISYDNATGQFNYEVPGKELPPVKTAPWGYRSPNGTYVSESIATPEQKKNWAKSLEPGYLEAQLVSKGLMTRGKSYSEMSSEERWYIDNIQNNPNPIIRVVGSQGVQTALTIMTLGLGALSVMPSPAQMKAIEKAGQLATNAGKANLKVQTARAAANLEISKGKLPSPRVSSALQQAELISREADAKFLNQIARSKLTIKQLAELEVKAGLSGVRGEKVPSTFRITEGVVDIGAAQERVTAAWRAVDKIPYSKNPAAHIKALDKLQIAQNELTQALVKSNSSLAPRYKIAPASTEALTDDMNRIIGGGTQATGEAQRSKGALAYTKRLWPEFKPQSTDPLKPGYVSPPKTGEKRPIIVLHKTTEADKKALAAYNEWKARQPVPFSVRDWGKGAAVMEKPVDVTVKSKVPSKEPTGSSTPKPSTPKILNAKPQPSVLPGVRTKPKTESKTSTKFETPDMVRERIKREQSQAGLEPVTSRQIGTVKAAPEVRLTPSTKPATKPSTRTTTRPSIVPGTKPAVKPGVITEAGVTAEAATKTKTAESVRVAEGIRTREGIKEATQTRTETQTKTEVATKTPAKTRGTTQRATRQTQTARAIKPVPLPNFNLLSEEEKREAIKAAGGAFTWRQGELNGKPVRHVVVNPFRQKDKTTVLGKPVEGALDVTGKGQAKRSITLTRGEAPKTARKFEGGAIDPVVSPTGKPRGVRIDFMRDPSVKRRNSGLQRRINPPRLHSKKEGRVFRTKIGRGSVLSRRPLGLKHRR